MDLDTLNTEYGSNLRRATPSNPAQVTTGEWLAVDEVQHRYKRLVLRIIAPETPRKFAATSEPNRPVVRHFHKPAAQPVNPHEPGLSREQQILKELGF